MTADPSRGITDITYDNFGNPTKIQFASGQYNTNVYSANGDKLKTTSRSLFQQNSVIPDMAELGLLTTESSDIEAVSASYGLLTTEYHGPVIYLNGSVHMVLFPGGYATINGTSVTFHYYTQDYLGNNRAVINGFFSQNALRDPPTAAGGVAISAVSGRCGADRNLSVLATTESRSSQKC